MKTTQTGRKYYECQECGHRTPSSSYLATCPKCGGRLKNIAVPQE